MLLGELRAAIAAVCGQLAATGLVVGTAGNVSARAGDLIAVTPSGLDYATLTAGLVGVHRPDGTPVEAPLQPSSELPLHLAVYAAAEAAGSSVGAIVHTHSPAATATSALVDEVPAIHYQVAAFGGPVAVAPYATYGTDELAAGVVTALAGRSACLLANHGAVTTGPDLATALTRARALEWVCDVYLRAAAAGRPRLLPPEEIATVVAKMAGYGQRPPVREGRDA
jgi:L-fuculose-phosphate aldolase